MLEPGPVHTSPGLHIIPQLGQEKSGKAGTTAIHGLRRQSLALCPVLTVTTTPREERLGKVKPKAGAPLKLIWFVQNRSYYPAHRIYIKS